MMQATEPWHRDNLSAGILFHRGPTARRSLLLQAKVRSVVMVVARILVHEPFQTALIQYDHKVEQIVAAVADHDQTSYPVTLESAHRKRQALRTFFGEGSSVD